MPNKIDYFKIKGFKNLFKNIVKSKNFNFLSKRINEMKKWNKKNY